MDSESPHPAPGRKLDAPAKPLDYRPVAADGVRPLAVLRAMALFVLGFVVGAFVTAILLVLILKPAGLGAAIGGIATVADNQRGRPKWGAGIAFGLAGLGALSVPLYLLRRHPYLWDRMGIMVGVGLVLLFVAAINGPHWGR